MLINLAKEVLTPYANNGNTGNCYEIFTYLEDLRTMGLTNKELDELNPLLMSIMQKNNKSNADNKIKNAIEKVKTYPLGNGLFIHHKKVISMKNVTQDDSYGDTSDKIYVFEDGSELGESIVGGADFADLKKCISNPTCKRFGCEILIPQFKKIAAETVPIYKNEMKGKFGEDETKWPGREKTTAAYNAQSQVATLTANLFNSLSEDERRTRMSDILKCEKDKLTADILRMVNKDCTQSTSYSLKQKDITKSNPTLKADGVFLNMYLNDTFIGKTQVKFNNGVYHKGKTSSLHSSWNATAFLPSLFEITPTSQ
jgi:hypothetical protein